MSTHLETLPDDVLAHIFRSLDLQELVGLQQCSKQLRDRVLSLGFPRYLTDHSQSHLTLNPPPSQWSPANLVRYHHDITSSLRHRRVHALQIGPTWSQPVIPTLSLSPDRLILGVGGRILVHPLVNHHDHSGKSVDRSREYMIAKKGTGSESDIVGTVDLGDDQIGIAQYDGTLQRFKLKDARLTSTAHYSHPRGMNIHTLAASSKGDLMMTTSSTGLVSLFRTNSPWIPAETFSLYDSARAWSSMVVSSSTSFLPPSLFLGITGGIAIHHLRPTGPDPQPSRLLTGPDLPKRSSPYDMTSPPTPSAHHPSLLLSSWYDSHLRLHDLRLSSSNPILEFSDPWQWADGSAIYSCAYLAEHHIAGGGARHGTVALFDIRQPKCGWSMFSPSGKGSPVYALKGEGGRIWGVTERRAFILAMDGSGEKEQGMVLNAARAPVERARERPSGWKGRGGKWGWTVRYDGKDECSGYDHSQRGISLFESLSVA